MTRAPECQCLFSSDFHGFEPAFRTFAQTLKAGPYRAGILGGDLLDEWLPPHEVDKLVGPELAGSKRLTEALALRQKELQSILESAGKPIFFVLGNHDVTLWPDSPLMTNLHGRTVEFEGWRLAGYRWTRMDRYPEEVASDTPHLEALVDENTILVTHSPPWGILDGLPGTRFRYGLKVLLTLKPRMHLFGHVHEHAGVEGHAVNGAWPMLRRFFAINPERRQATLL